MQQSSRGICIAGMVVGIVSIIFTFIGGFLTWIGLVAAIVGLVLSIIGMKKSKETGEPRGMAIAGLVTSIVALAIWVIVFACVAAAACAIGGMASQLGDLASMM